MINIFRKKKDKNMHEWEYQLLKTIVEKLPSKYSFLKNQINSEFILDSVPNELLKHGWRRVLCNQNLYNVYKNDEINYKLIGITVYDLKGQNYKSVELDLYEGIIIGYKVDDNSGQFSIEKINLEHLEEKHYINKDKEALEKILGNFSKDLISNFELENTFKIKLPDGVFYVIKELGNGDYLSVNSQGAIFGMIHDPYKIEKLFDNKEAFFQALKAKNFSISEYYNKRMI